MHTVVTACDHKFVWGAMLLGLSLRFHEMTCAFHILGYDLSDDDIACLQSIPNCKVFSTHKTDTRSVCTQKPMAINTAETDLIVWMDADCVVSGNLEKFFICPEDRIQIRLRKPLENKSVFRNYYHRKDTLGEIPKQVLQTWQHDVADRKQSRISTVYQTNCFVLNKSHLPFIELWKNQMLKVIPADTKGVYNTKSAAYSMTDESVINSLFAFSSSAPQTAEYLMDKDPAAACIHFGLNPKPWQHFTFSALQYYDYLQELITWAKQTGIRLPQIPPSLLPENKAGEIFRARLRHTLRSCRYSLSTKMRALIRLSKV
jgi:hypothetical protein